MAFAYFEIAELCVLFTTPVKKTEVGGRSIVNGLVSDDGVASAEFPPTDIALV
jgi:hypothetical protein